MPLALWVLVVIPILAGCAVSSGAPSDGNAALVRDEPSANTVTRFATASVSIVDTSDRSAPAIARIVLSPDPMVVDVGDSVQVWAQAVDQFGQAVAGVEFVWSTVDPRAGFIDREGRFVAGSKLGIFESAISVTAVRNGPEGTTYHNRVMAVTVVGEQEAPKLASITIFPERPVVLDQQIYRLRAVAFDDGGVLIPGAALEWHLNDPSLGRLSVIGYLTASGGEGLYREAITVTATWQGKTIAATTDVNVLSAPRTGDFLRVEALPQRFYLEPGGQMQLRAVTLNGLGEVLRGTVLRWSVGDPAAGTIDARGMFRASDTPGIYTEAVQVEAVVPGGRGFVRAVDFASVVIRGKRTSPRVVALSVIPESIVVAPGGRAVLLVRALDEAGYPAKDITILWRTLNPQVGQVDVNGGFTASHRPGIYDESLQVTVEQVIEGDTVTLTKTVGVTITGTLDRAQVEPEMVTVAPGETVHVTMNARDENGTLLPGLVTAWNVSDEIIGTIDAYGNFTAGDVIGMFEDAIVGKVTQILPDEP